MNVILYGKESADEDHPNFYIDHIELWILGFYIHMAFYPLEFWAWECYIDTNPEPRFIVRVEFPSFSLYIAGRY